MAAFACPVAGGDWQEEEEWDEQEWEEDSWLQWGGFPFAGCLSPNHDFEGSLT